MKIVQAENRIIRDLVRRCFATDPDLLNRWHIAAPATLEQCVEKTMRDVDSFDESFRFYLIFSGENLVGYFGTEFGNYLNLIFVKPEFRNSDFMPEFWASICKQMQKPFATAVYSKNKPAISFYSKRGRKVADFKANGHEATSFVFEKDEDSCQ